MSQNQHIIKTQPVTISIIPDDEPINPAVQSDYKALKPIMSGETHSHLEWCVITHPDAVKGLARLAEINSALLEAKQLNMSPEQTLSWVRGIVDTAIRQMGGESELYTVDEIMGSDNGR